MRSDYVDDAMVKLDDWFKTSLRQIVDPLQEYLLGQRPALKVSVSLSEPTEVLYQTLFEAFNRFPQPELKYLSPLEKQQAFNQFFFYELAVLAWLVLRDRHQFLSFSILTSAAGIILAQFNHHTPAPPGKD
ncbi:hypothetical protein Dehly_0215 [Dehalogenimonas lykanthroporepellens BL-DC-9]|jgi:hypothetical protein|nr:hypothetical protein Dehly_0215 [Dehalogenimonas lykanthroporepellens BL-DC-9]